MRIKHTYKEVEYKYFYRTHVSESCSVLSNSLRSKDLSPPVSFVHRDSPGKNTGVRLPCLPLEDLPNPGTEPRFTHIAGGFFTS